MRNAHIVVDLGFGDAGKGRVVSELCGGKDIGCIVRYSGGPQNAHNVVWRDERGKLFHHTYSQIGSSGSKFTPTLTLPSVPVNILSLVNETLVLSEKTGKHCGGIFVSRDCPLILPCHIEANLWREKSRKKAHGTTGNGIGEVKMFEARFPNDAVRIGDLYDEELLLEKVTKYVAYSTSFGVKFEFDAKRYVSDFLKFIVECVDADSFNIVSDTEITGLLENTAGDVVFEGSQGVLLDADYGFFPHVTFGTMIPILPMTLCEKLSLAPIVYGVTRTYQTRHGAGPFPTEYAVSSEEHQYFSALEKHNIGGAAGSMRYGSADMNLLKYSAGCLRFNNVGIDNLVITHCDIDERHLYSSEISAGYKIPQSREEQIELTEQLFRETTRTRKSTLDELCEQARKITGAIDVITIGSKVVGEGLTGL
ncbi:adenylosuccinate synthetase [Clostridia bacterium]|nr:adenylosuccinate synthetase [Clostridia bacterium]